jgi:hypothetical protein
MAVNTPLFATNWYELPLPSELRAEVLNLYDLNAERRADIAGFRNDLQSIDAAAGAGITALRNDLNNLDASLDSRYLSLAGGTLTGELNVVGASSSPIVDFINNTLGPGNRRWRMVVFGSEGNFSIRPRTDGGGFVHDGLVLSRSGRARFQFDSGHLAEIYSSTDAHHEGSYVRATFLRGLLFVEDTRDDNDPPSAYRRSVSFELKRRTVVGVPGSGSFCGVMTFKPWPTTISRAFQLAFGESGVYARRSSADHASWGSWITLGTF